MLCLPTLHQMPTKWEDLQQPQDQHGRFWRVTITSAGTLLEHQKDGHWNFGHNTSLCEQYTQLSEWAGGKGKDIPSAIFYFRVFGFFSERKFRTNETEKVTQSPWQVKTARPECFAKTGPYPARAPRVLQRNTLTTEIAKKGWLKKTQWPAERQHKAVVYCSQTSATLTKLQEVSFAQYSCKATAFSCWLWRGTRMARFPGELELPGKWSPMSRCTEGFECCLPF